MFEDFGRSKVHQFHIDEIFFKVFHCEISKFDH
jgi:hypothetical protein